MKWFYIIAFLHLFVSVKADLWNQKANSPTKYVRKAGSFAIGNKGYAVAGVRYSMEYCDSLWEYDPALDIWSSKALFPGGKRANVTAIAILDKGYVGFGIDNTFQFSNEWWEYSAQNNTWTQRASFPGQLRQMPIIFSINSCCYVVGGGDSSGLFNDVWEYNSSTDVWTAKNNFPGVERWRGFGFSIQGFGYIGGGQSVGIPNDFWKYDPNTDFWSLMGTLPNDKNVDQTAFSIDKYGFLYGGETISTNCFNIMWQYKADSNIWVQKNPCPVSYGRDEYVAISIGGKGYIGWGGLQGPNFIDFWEYIPDIDSVTSVSEMESNFKDFIFPNPNTSNTPIFFSKPLRDASIEVLDEFGRIMTVVNNISGNSININEQYLRRGIFIFRVFEKGKLIGHERIVFN